jgi:hypothetical protein
MWGLENSTLRAIEVARELEIELKGVLFVRNTVKDFFNEMSELLFAIDADEDLIYSIIRDGHQEALSQVKYDSKRKLLLDEKPELRRVILEKTENYII